MCFGSRPPHRAARYALACAALLLTSCDGDDDQSFVSSGDSASPRGSVDGGRDVAPREKGDEQSAGEARRDAGTILVGDASAREDECGLLRARVRDFSLQHPDFEDVVNGRVVTGMVESELGPDQKPVAIVAMAEQNGIKRFDQWYADDPSVNHPFEVEIALDGDGGGRFVFDSSAFFPIDGRGFGNEYQAHNFHFTTEIHTRFTYRSGDRFTFAGDDDLWLFINRRLALDLGGVHARETKSVDLDELASELGIEIGGSYAMDIFHAERHTGESNFRIETTIECLEPVFVQ